jgi:hypothetical protein
MHGSAARQRTSPPEPIPASPHRPYRTAIGKPIRPNVKHQLKPQRQASGGTTHTSLSRCCLVCCENFPSSGQVRPSAAAAGRRAGPVLASLRAAGPVAAHDKGPDDRERKFSHHRAPAVWSCCCRASGPAFSAADPRHGRSPPVKAPAGPCGITLRVSLDRRRPPVRIGHYEGRPSE